MISYLFATVLPLVVGIAVAVLTYLLTKRKEREADWRKMKLDLCKNFIMALPAQISDFTDIQPAYVEATNALGLVAPPSVLDAVATFNESFAKQQTKISGRTLQTLLRTLRRDIYPNHRHTKENFDLPFFQKPIAPKTNPFALAESN